jgi:hypothetical protein
LARFGVAFFFSVLAEIFAARDLGLADIRCCGPAFAMSRMNCSKRAHASGSSSTSLAFVTFFGFDFAMDESEGSDEASEMNPLSRVKPRAPVTLSAGDEMITRPALAIKVAQCIAMWAEIEYVLGTTLALILGTEAKAALAMYLSLGARRAQIGALTAAAKYLPTEQEELFSAIMLGWVHPAAKQRDRYAHWCWGYTAELPDSLLLIEPTEKIKNMAAMLSPSREVKFNRNHVFVVTLTDVEKTLELLTTAKNYAVRMSGFLWERHTPEKRAESLRQLSNEPPIRSALIRLREARKKNPEAQQR